MLILSRRIGERIRIGDDIVLQVTKIDGLRVWIGIEAPTTVPVHREEIWQEIQKQKAGA